MASQASGRTVNVVGDGAIGMASLVTVVITTSPTPSAPSTDLLSAVVASFRAHCPGLLACPVIVVFDAYDHVESRARLKKGCVTETEAKCYAAYKDNVRQLVKETWGGTCGGETVDAAPGPSWVPDEVTTGIAEYGSPCIANNNVSFVFTRTAGGRIAFVEPQARLGFGLAVRTALRAVTTPYVWIQQHDWTLAADIPLTSMVEVMLNSEASIDLKAKEAQDTREAMDVEGGTAKEDVDEDTGGKLLPNDNADEDTEAQEALVEGEWWQQPVEDDGTSEPATSSLDNYDGQDTDGQDDDEDDKIVPVRYICLPSVRMLRYAGSAHVIQFPSLRALTARLKRDFPVNAAASATSAPSPSALPLTPLFFWHDKTHLASTAHYLERVFPSRLAVGRGDFIEDHIGQRARNQMKHDPRLWRKWAMWLYYPDDGNLLCLRHLQGRTWRGEVKERELRDLYRERNRSAASAAAAAANNAAREVAVPADDMINQPTTDTVSSVSMVWDATIFQ